MITAALVLAVLGSDGGSTAAPDPAGFAGYLEWMLNLKLTQAQTDELGVLAARAWETQSEADLKLVTRGDELHKDLANYTAEERTGLRSSVEDEYFKTLKRRGNGQPIARWIAALRTGARRKLAPGPPALTQQASDALAELVVHVVGEPPADAAFRTAFAKALAAGYKRLAPAQRTAVAAAPIAWARLRAEPPPRREELRAQWRAAVMPDAGAALDPRLLASVAAQLAQSAAAGWE